MADWDLVLVSLAQMICIPRFFTPATAPPAPHAAGGTTILQRREKSTDHPHKDNFTERCEKFIEYLLGIKREAEGPNEKIDCNRKYGDSDELRNRRYSDDQQRFFSNMSDDKTTTNQNYKSPYASNIRLNRSPEYTKDDVKTIEAELQGSRVGLRDEKPPVIPKTEEPDKATIEHFTVKDEKKNYEATTNFKRVDEEENTWARSSRTVNKFYQADKRLYKMPKHEYCINPPKVDEALRIGMTQVVHPYKDLKGSSRTTQTEPISNKYKKSIKSASKESNQKDINSYVQNPSDKPSEKEARTNMVNSMDASKANVANIVPTPDLIKDKPYEKHLIKEESAPSSKPIHSDFIVPDSHEKVLYPYEPQRTLVHDKDFNLKHDYEDISSDKTSSEVPKTDSLVNPRSKEALHLGMTHIYPHKKDDQKSNLAVEKALDDIQNFGAIQTTEETSEGRLESKAVIRPEFNVTQPFHRRNTKPEPQWYQNENTETTTQTYQNQSLESPTNLYQRENEESATQIDQRQNAQSSPLYPIQNIHWSEEPYDNNAASTKHPDYSEISEPSKHYPTRKVKSDTEREIERFRHYEAIHENTAEECINKECEKMTSFVHSKPIQDEDPDIAKEIEPLNPYQQNRVLTNDVIIDHNYDIEEIKPMVKSRMREEELSTKEFADRITMRPESRLSHLTIASTKPARNHLTDEITHLDNMAVKPLEQKPFLQESNKIRDSKKQEHMSYVKDPQKPNKDKTIYDMGAGSAFLHSRKPNKPETIYDWGAGSALNNAVIGKTPYSEEIALALKSDGKVNTDKNEESITTSEIPSTENSKNSTYFTSLETKPIQDTETQTSKQIRQEALTEKEMEIAECHIDACKQQQQLEVDLKTWTVYTKPLESKTDVFDCNTQESVTLMPSKEEFFVHNERKVDSKRIPESKPDIRKSNIRDLAENVRKNIMKVKKAYFSKPQVNQAENSCSSEPYQPPMQMSKPLGNVKVEKAQHISDPIEATTERSIFDNANETQDKTHKLLVERVLIQKEKIFGPVKEAKTFNNFKVNPRQSEGNHLTSTSEQKLETSIPHNLTTSNMVPKSVVQRSESRTNVAHQSNELNDYVRRIVSKSVRNHPGDPEKNPTLSGYTENNSIPRDKVHQKLESSIPHNLTSNVVPKTVDQRPEIRTNFTHQSNELDDYVRRIVSKSVRNHPGDPEKNPTLPGYTENNSIPRVKVHYQRQQPGEKGKSDKDDHDDDDPPGPKTGGTPVSRPPGSSSSTSYYSSSGKYMSPPPNSTSMNFSKTNSKYDDVVNSSKTVENIFNNINAIVPHGLPQKPGYGHRPNFFIEQHLTQTPSEVLDQFERFKLNYTSVRPEDIGKKAEPGSEPCKKIEAENLALTNHKDTEGVEKFPTHNPYAHLATHEVAAQNQIEEEIKAAEENLQDKMNGTYDSRETQTSTYQEMFVGSYPLPQNMTNPLNVSVNQSTYPSHTRSGYPPEEERRNAVFQQNTIQDTVTQDMSITTEPMPNRHEGESNQGSMSAMQAIMGMQPNMEDQNTFTETKNVNEQQPNTCVSQIMPNILLSSALPEKKQLDDIQINELQLCLKPKKWPDIKKQPKHSPQRILYEKQMDEVKSNKPHYLNMQTYGNKFNVSNEPANYERDFDDVQGRCFIDRCPPCPRHTEPQPPACPPPPCQPKQRPNSTCSSVPSQTTQQTASKIRCSRLPCNYPGSRRR